MKNRTISDDGFKWLRETCEQLQQLQGMIKQGQKPKQLLQQTKLLLLSAEKALKEVKEA